jgi:hypothetical protein
MKPEDLIQGKKYIDRVYRDKTYRFIDANDRDCGIYKDDTWRFEDFDGKEIILNARRIENLDEIEGEKTMPVLRKPEELKILLTEEEFSRAISSLGYDLEDYTIGYLQIELTFTLKKTSVNITQTSTPVVTVKLGTIGVVN